MKLTTQLTVVIVTAIVGMIGLVVGLAVLADWSDGAILAMVTGFGSVLVTTVIAIRNQAHTAQAIDQLQRVVGAGQRDQANTLDTVVRQTNGQSSAEREDLAVRAAQAALRLQAPTE